MVIHRVSAVPHGCGIMDKILLNPHYNFDDPNNITCQAEVAAYDAAFTNKDEAALLDAEKLALKGASGYAIGVSVESPWGENKVLSAQTGEGGQDVVKKEITVKPGFMLSLQRHRGRKELWEVKSGTLTVISDGERIEVNAGDHISLPKGNVHCMNNVHDTPVTVVETQTGFCREADNVRLVDFNGRPTIPLATATEARSAILYAEMHQEIEKKFGCDIKPAVMLTTSEYRQIVEELKTA